jgi:hypothetical protein
VLVCWSEPVGCSVWESCPWRDSRVSRGVRLGQEGVLSGAWGVCESEEQQEGGLAGLLAGWLAGWLALPVRDTVQGPVLECPSPLR